MPSSGSPAGIVMHSRIGGAMLRSTSSIGLPAHPLWLERKEIVKGPGAAQAAANALRLQDFGGNKQSRNERHGTAGDSGSGSGAGTGCSRIQEVSRALRIGQLSIRRLPVTGAWSSPTDPSPIAFSLRKKLLPRGADPYATGAYPHWTPKKNGCAWVWTVVAFHGGARRPGQDWDTSDQMLARPRSTPRLQVSQTSTKEKYLLSASSAFRHNSS
jgi:hypothetical protein